MRLLAWLREVTGSYGRFREVPGGYGRLRELTGSYGRLREVTGDLDSRDSTQILDILEIPIREVTDGYGR